MYVRVCMSECVHRCVSMHLCRSLAVCVDVLGADSMGSPGRATATLLTAQPSASGCVGLEHVPFCEIYKILLRVKLLECLSLGSLPCLHVLHTGLDCAPHCWEPGSADYSICGGRRLSPFQPWAPLEP